MSANKSIRDFFKPHQAVMKTAAPVGVPASQASSSNSRVSPISAPRPPEPQSSQTQVGHSNSVIAKAPEHVTSSLSPPSSDPKSPQSPPKEVAPVLPPSSNGPSGRVVKSSDDEDEDSDSSLEDLSTIFASKNSENPPRPVASGKPPSTPTTSNYQKSMLNFHSSPLAVLPKYKFDLMSLASQAKKDDAIEASSKRVKAMMAPEEKEESNHLTHEDKADQAKFAHGALLESVVARREDGGMDKVTRALKRTEATVTEKHWYFFQTGNQTSKPERKPFPNAIVPEDWQRDLVEPRLRYHSFVSGYVEDLVSFGRALPDELFLWILDEMCFETEDPLRISYLNTLRNSSEQVHRLILPDILQSVFCKLGATSNATIASQKIRPSQAVLNPYLSRDWTKVCYLIRFLGGAARSLQHISRIYIVCILLRMSADPSVLGNIELLCSIQETISRLCQHTTQERWEAWCAEICKSLFDSVEQSTLRLQMLDSILSTSSRTHDLRRRLALCFYFNDISYSLDQPHNIMILDRFIGRLDGADFDTTPQTDYRELTALVLLLDIAIDDGRSMMLDLTDKATEQKFDETVDALVAAIKDIMTSIGSPGAAFISRIEAKEALELVSQRVTDTIRSKPKPKHSWFDRNRIKAEENLEQEKKLMSKFVSRKDVGNGIKVQFPK